VTLCAKERRGRDQAPPIIALITPLRDVPRVASPFKTAPMNGRLGDELLETRSGADRRPVIF
jgi:hypothetical protein